MIERAQQGRCRTNGVAVECGFRPDGPLPRTTTPAPREREVLAGLGGRLRA